MLCNNCGKEIGIDNFCHLCGVNQTPQPSRNKPASSKMSSTHLIVGIVATVLGFIVPLSAHAQYTNKTKFTEVTAVTDGVRKQVELCLFDTEDLSQCNNSMKGIGWQIYASEDYATRYVASVTVNNGVITAKAIDGDDLRGATFTIKPIQDKKSWMIDWKVVPEQSSCFSQGLCGHTGR